MANAVPVYVPLHPPTWMFDPQELRSAFNKKTRAIIINTPHNPSGRVFTHEELSLIAELCIEHDVTIIADEVYEHLTFSPAHHLSISTLPGMFERTVTVSSAGKTFSVTGWRVGWVYGPRHLIKGVQDAHQFVAFAAHHPSQEAIAYALTLSANYYTMFQTMYEKKRQLLLDALDAAKLTYFAPEGTYFVLANYTQVFEGKPLDFTRYLIQEIGVACIPPESFYSPQHMHIGHGYVRFAFCKNDELLQQVQTRLLKLEKN